MARTEALLKLRLLKISGDLPAYLACHFDQEHQRHQPGPQFPVTLPSGMNSKCRHHHGRLASAVAAGFRVAERRSKKAASEAYLSYHEV
ncbi:hypothetical protein CCR91_21090 [Thiorhodovibrio winogradskyi]|nr:hypothetical protein [Thiorhodovibrio winogradskyi]